MHELARFREAAVVWAAGGDGADAAAEVTRSLAPRVATVVLVEGPSDAAALEVFAARSGRDLAAERIVILPVGGATAVRRFLEPFGPRGLDLRLAGLVDEGEERFFRQVVQGSDRHPELNRDEMEQLGFFVCVADLEDELIRAVGVDGVLEVIGHEGQTRALRTFRTQPAQRDRAIEQQLHRFMGTMTGRKSRYAAALAAAVPAERMPAPIAGLLRFMSHEPS